MKGRILIACRDESCLEGLQNLFAGEGLIVDSVCNEDDLLLDILENDYNAIIYDLERSGLDGFKMVRILRRIRPKVALVVVSNNPSRELGGRILNEGVLHYAVKPLNPDTMKAVVTNALAEMSGHAQTEK